MSPLLIAALLVIRQTSDLETSLQSNLRGAKIGSSEFNKRFDACLKTHKLTAKWEHVYGPTPAMVAEFQSDGSDGMLPFGSLVIWTDPSGIRVQILEELDTWPGDDDDKFNAVIDGKCYRDGNRMVRCGTRFYGGNWGNSDARIYRLAGGRWSTVGKRGGEYLAAYPGTQFSRRNGKIDPSTVIAMGNEYPDHLSQPHAGPLLLFRETWKLSGDRIKEVSSKLVPTALSELNRLASLAQAGQRKQFNRLVPKKYGAEMWKPLKNQICVTCPHPYEVSDCNTLSVWSIGGAIQNGTTTTMHFKRTNGAWRLSSVEYTKQEE